MSAKKARKNRNCSAAARNRTGAAAPKPAEADAAAAPEAAPAPERGGAAPGDIEWNSAPEIIKAAREVLGGIDLDPTTNKAAQKIIKATRYYTIHDDGLTKDWYGKVWLNPPYTHPLIDQFTDKLITEYRSGRTTDALLLAQGSTDTIWFHKVLAACSAICLTRGRIKFWKPGGRMSQVANGHVIFYFTQGNDISRFSEVFSRIGSIVVLYAPFNGVLGARYKIAT